MSIPVLLVRLAFAIALIGLVVRLVTLTRAEDIAGSSSVLKPQTAPEHANSVRDGWLDTAGRDTAGMRYEMRNNAWDQLVAAVLEMGGCTWTPSPWAADNWRGMTNCTKFERKPVKIGGGGNIYKAPSTLY